MRVDSEINPNGYGDQSYELRHCYNVRVFIKQRRQLSAREESYEAAFLRTEVLIFLVTFLFLIHISSECCIYINI